MFVKTHPLIWLYSVVRALVQLVELLLFTSIGGSLLVLECLVFKIRWVEDRVMQVWARTQLRFAGVTVEVRGAENIPPEGTLFLFNHMSYADIYVTFGHIPRGFRFGAKIELFKIPIFGQTMKAVGVLPIVRNNREEVLRVYANAVERVRRGECFALAPEGTRQSEPQLGKFKQGPFIFAINAQMPIVPVLMAGTRQVQPRGVPWMNIGALRRTVILELLPAISTKGYTLETARELCDHTFAIMDREHQKLFAEYRRRFQ
jgi:1-acyl-sn-glycerol-3-phosphate acyltransferase